jgi:type II secretory pathway component PulK
MLMLVVLGIIAVLALIAVSFSYRMDAERMGIQALGDLQQARMACGSGLDRVLLILRDDRTNMDLWYKNPEAFRRAPVWMPDDREGFGGSDSLSRKEVVPNQPAWRFSVCSYDVVNEDRTVIRYGLTDEAGKLNINFASRGQLLRLFKDVELGDVPVETLVDSLIDWRDRDNKPNSSAGAESPYYMTLSPAYRAKNRPFDSVEELLMVKNWTGPILFGEDYNRNGYLDENEDDGEDGAFPPDDGNGQLNRGLSRLLTVYSWDWNFGDDNKPRTDINSASWDNPDKLPKHLQEELNAETISFIAEARKRGFKFRSVGELWGLEVYEDGSTNYDDAWDEYRKQVKEENAITKSDKDEATSQPADGRGEGGTGGDGQGSGDDNPKDNGQGNDNSDGKDGKNEPGKDNGGNDNRADAGPGGKDASGSTDNADNADNPDNNNARNKNDRRRQQAVREQGGTGRTPGRGSGRTGNRTGNNGADRNPGRDNNADDRGGRGNDRNGGADGDEAGNNNGRDRNRTGGRDRNRDGNQGGNDRGRGGNRTGTGNQGGAVGTGGGREGDGKPANSGGQDGTGNQGGTGPGGNADQGTGEDSGQDKEAKKGTPIVSPVSPEQMNLVMDRLTATPSPTLIGQININTAPLEVLRTIIGLTDEEAKAIVERRRQMAGPDKKSVAWLVATGALTPQKFAVISNKITSRSIQFTADIVGFADHVGTFRRIQTVIEMRGHMAQIRYYRDISSLGMGYPVKDDERSEGFAFGNE